jgi:hypothetical protein
VWRRCRFSVVFHISVILVDVTRGEALSETMEGASVSTNPRTVEEVFKDFKGRRAGMLKALTSGNAGVRFNFLFIVRCCRL